MAYYRRRPVIPHVHSRYRRAAFDPQSTIGRMGMRWERTCWEDPRRAYKYYSRSPTDQEIARRAKPPRLPPMSERVRREREREREPVPVLRRPMPTPLRREAEDWRAWNLLRDTQNERLAQRALYAAPYLIPVYGRRVPPQLITRDYRRKRHRLPPVIPPRRKVVVEKPKVKVEERLPPIEVVAEKPERPVRPIVDVDKVFMRAHERLPSAHKETEAERKEREMRERDYERFFQELKPKPRKVLVPLTTEQVEKIFASEKSDKVKKENPIEEVYPIEMVYPIEEVYLAETEISFERK